MICKVNRITVVVANQEEALRFYTEKLGFEKRNDEQTGTGDRWVTVAPMYEHDVEVVLQPVDRFEGGERERHEAMIGRSPEMVFGVDDCREAYNELRDRGVGLVSVPAATEGGMRAVVRDLYGNRLVLLERQAWLRASDAAPNTSEPR